MCRAREERAGCAGELWCGSGLSIARFEHVERGFEHVERVSSAVSGTWSAVSGAVSGTWSAVSGTWSAVSSTWSGFRARGAGFERVERASSAWSGLRVQHASVVVRMVVRLWPALLRGRRLCQHRAIRECSSFPCGLGRFGGEQPVGCPLGF